jgi:hypothetical protein
VQWSRWLCLPVVDPAAVCLCGHWELHRMVSMQQQHAAAAAAAAAQLSSCRTQQRVCFKTELTRSAGAAVDSV